jgi:hypothetical protein
VTCGHIQIAFHTASLVDPGVRATGIWLRLNAIRRTAESLSCGLFGANQMLRKSIFRRQANAAMRKLPKRRPDRTWGGPGTGAPCAVCGHSVTRDELEYEIEFARDGDDPGLDKFHVHIKCFQAWGSAEESS